MQGAAALAVMTLTAGTLWWSGQAHDQEHIHALKAMTATIDAQAELQQHILTIRLGVLRVYDPLIDDIDALRRAHAQMATLTPQVVGHTPSLDSAVTALAATTDHKSVLVDRYIRQVSKYRNSLTHLPEELDQWTRSVEGDPASTAQTAAANKLVRLALTYNGTPTDEFRTQLLDALSAAESLPELSSAPTQQRWTLLLRHIRIVLDITEPLNNTMDQLLNPDVQRAVQWVHTAYVDAYGDVQQTRTTLQRIIYGLVLVSGLLFANLILRLHALYATLEHRIARRTQELAEVVAGSRLILDNVGEGLISVELDGLPGSQASTALRTWLGEPSEAEPIWQWLGRYAPEQAQWLEMGWEDLQAGFMPHEVILAQLPSRIELDDRTLGLRYRPILDATGNVKRVLLMMRDITHQEKVEQKQAWDAERLVVLMHAMNDQAGLHECMEQTAILLDQLQISIHDTLLSKRQLHTIKGNVGMYGMLRMADYCHRLETRLDERGSTPTMADVAELRHVWKHYEEEVEPFFVGDCTTSRHAAELQSIATLIEQRVPYEQLSAKAATWTEESMVLRLARLGRQAEQLGQRLGRPVDVHIQDNGVRTPPHILDSLWLIVPHIIRNALDHGLEDPDVRVSQGKSSTGLLVLTTRREDNAFVLSIRDDGAGIDWDVLRDKATILGMPHRSRSDLEDALFADGVSSRETVSQFSGRGIGMAAVRQATEHLRGTLTVHSVTRVGTTIECRIPSVFRRRDRMAG
ncbi:MAG: two-component system chemotaxis sensor kinase CheA [Myxococcota bacterium]|jgi:two-component system chemotaxis sensor kinase CheA